MNSKQRRKQRRRQRREMEVLAGKFAQGAAASADAAARLHDLGRAFSQVGASLSAAMTFTPQDLAAIARAANALSLLIPRGLPAANRVNPPT